MKHATEEERLEARRASFRKFAAKKRAALTEEEKQARRDAEKARYQASKNDPEKIARRRASNRRNYVSNGYDKVAKAAGEIVGQNCCVHNECFLPESCPRDLKRP